MSVLVYCISCSEMKDSIADLQDRVNKIEEQLAALKTAYEDGKIIKDVTPYNGEGNTGWVITFSDNETITIFNGINGEDGADGTNGKDGVDGKDGITPIVTINSEGYWEVSYDNGVTYVLLTDKDGNPVMSRGEKGNEGLSVRVVVNDEGYYVIEMYYKSDEDTVVGSITTPYSSDPASQIVSIVKDPINGIIILVMGDGSEYMFNLDVTFPTGIVVLVEELVLPKNGTSAFAFRVNPSNAVVDLDITKEEPMFELDRAIDEMTRSYVTASENYQLDKIEPATDSDGNVKVGQYIAYVTDLGISSDYCEGATLVLNTKDGKGEKIQLSSDIFKIKTPDKPQFTTFSLGGAYASDLSSEFVNVKLPYGTDVSALTVYFVVSEGVVTVDGEDVLPNSSMNFSSPIKFTITARNGVEADYYVSVSYSDIPVVYINTKDAAPVTSKDTWLKGTEIYVTNAGEHNSLYSNSQIKGRGNSTWGYPKKPYAIKLDSKEEVLGMPKHKRWVLLANYVDKTCLRNSIAFEISKRSSGLDWTPRGYHVDVVLNGVFQGNYYLCEQIKGDENRVNKPDDGYLIEIDKNFDEVSKFYSPIRNMPFMLKEPDEEEITPESFAYIQNRVTEIETALYGAGSTTEGYLKYIDLDSFIDYWLVYELTATGEPTHPKSVYMWTDYDGIFHAGPVWDFDYYTFQPYYNTMLINTNAVWNDRIINDPNNRAAIKARWMDSCEKYRIIPEEIDRQYTLIKESAEYDAKLWPVDPAYYINGTKDPNREKDLTVEQSVARMKEFYEAHFEYMDSYIKSF